MCWQFSRYSTHSEQHNVEAPAEPTTPSRRTLRTPSFKDLILFVDKKEAEIKDAIRRKSGDHSKRNPSQVLDKPAT